VIVALTVALTLPLVRECAQHILLGTPTNVDALALLKELRALPDVIDVRWLAV
jgi:hypothetical protein